jgi:hypothetical protein
LTDQYEYSGEPLPRGPASVDIAGAGTKRPLFSDISSVTSVQALIKDIHAIDLSIEINELISVIITASRRLAKGRE